MIRATRAMVQKWLEGLLHIHDSPQRTAAAYALGVFFGFSPFLGLHTVLAIIFAFVLNLNRVAVLVGVYSNLPWILPPYYTLTTAVGAELLRMKLPAGFTGELQELFSLSFWHADFWRQLITILRPFLWPYTVGSLLGAAVLATLAYRVALAFVIARRKHHHHHHFPGIRRHRQPGAGKDHPKP